VAELVSATADPLVEGSVVLYRLYDVGYEVDLERALDVLATTAEERAALRLTLEKQRRVEAQAIRIENPPITIPLGPDTLVTGQRRHAVQLSARIFDFGAVSIRLHLAIPPSLVWSELAGFGDALQLTVASKAVFDGHVQRLTGRIGAAIARPELGPVSEDYVVYRLTRLVAPDGQSLLGNRVRELDLVPLLLNEDRPISEQARRELLPHWFSYYADDLSVITWNTALVLDPVEGDSDVQLILEFANAHLLELRYYDALLDAELPRMNDRIASARAGGRALLGHRYASLLGELQTRVADSTEIVERAENALRVTDDVYLARVYAAALEVFRERAWRSGIDRKLGILHQTYAMLNAESMAARNEVLEVTIIILIVVEIVLALILGRG
jgi:hypothetical protein